MFERWVTPRVRRYAKWPGADIMRKCDRYMKWVHKNPPHVTGWLKGGVAVRRMQKIKRQIEGGTI